MQATAQTLIPDVGDTVRIVRASREPVVLAACERCETRGSADQMLLTGTGHLCQSCELESDLDAAAARSFWTDLVTGVALAFASPGALLAAVLLSGLLVPALQSLTGAMFLLYAAAGLAVMQGVFGLWTAVTGGNRDLPLTPARRTVLRSTGVVSALLALCVGGGLLAVNVAMVIGS